MCKLPITFRNKSIEWDVIKFNALRDRHRKVCEPQLGKHSWYVLEMAVQFSSVAQSCPTLCNPMDCVLQRWDVHPFSLVAPHSFICLSSIPGLSASFSLADIHGSFWFIGSEGRRHFSWGLGKKKGRDVDDSCQFPISGWGDGRGVGTVCSEEAGLLFPLCESSCHRSAVWQSQENDHRPDPSAAAL